MPAAPLPPDEQTRLAALQSYDILDTENEAALDELVALAARLTGHPMALISLLDAERQWFKARFGVEARETPRDAAFCAHAILTPDRPLVVADALRDARFADSPLVTGPPGIRAYVGVPLLSGDGHALGTLCVLDAAPRDTGEDAVAALQVLSRAVVANLELRRTARHLFALAQRDPLTGLANRTALRTALGKLAATRTPVAVITADLDYFKEVNDAEGHEAGDALIRAAADRLRAALRPCDIVGRLGGDEFAAFLPGIAKPGRAATIATRIQAALNRPVRFGGRMLPLAATLGVALVPAQSTDAELGLRLADQALLRAKRAGRGSIGWASAQDVPRLRRAAAVLRTFGEGEGAHLAALHLQPIISLADDPPRLRAVEALTRWRHPELGEVAPDELFAIIGPAHADSVAEAVRGKALDSVAALRAEGFAVPRIALNLSATEAARRDICDRLARQVAIAGLTLSAIEIEITEEVLLDRVSDRTLDGLAALRSAGARLVLDDFGTGNSGLSQLMRLPLDALKLDRRFVRGMTHDARAAEIVKATVGLARGLGLEVIAEGVETAREAALAREHGCDGAQGFFYARSLAPATLRGWLRGLSAARGGGAGRRPDGRLPAAQSQRTRLAARASDTQATVAGTSSTPGTARSSAGNQCHPQTAVAPK